MKKLLLIALVLFAFAAQSQIVLTKDTVRVNVGSEWKYITHRNYLNQKTPIPISQDSVIYTYSVFPEKLERLQQIGFYWVNDTCFEWTNKTKVEQTIGGRLIMYQYIRKSVLKLVEKTSDEKLWFYTQKAKEVEYNNMQFFNYKDVQAIVKPVVVVIDSLAVDSLIFNYK